MSIKQSAINHILLFIAGVALFIIGCSQRPQCRINTVIGINLGENVVISLGSNRTTGYQWQLASPVDKNILELVGSEYITPKTQLVGAGGKEVWTFKTLARGKTIISFKYVRLWEKGVLPVQTATFTVIVK
jgi:inhibitor of cysteine peptidase